jgi:hypothetical protein
MPSFYNAERNYLLSTSLKVMYSSLTLQPALRPLRTDLHAALRTWSTPGLRRYLLVRDPYERLVSFHADKLRAALPSAAGGRWQSSQRIFFPALGLSGEEPAGAIAERLRALDFEDFIRLVPRVHRADPHLWPQWWTRSFRVRGVALPAPVHRVFKIEEMDLLAEELGLDRSIRVNETSHESADRSFTPASYTIANHIYGGDFASFSYRMRWA